MSRFKSIYIFYFPIIINVLRKIFTAASTLNTPPPSSCIHPLTITTTHRVDLKLPDTLVIVCTESKPWHWQMDNVLLSLWGVGLMLNCFFCCRVLSTSRTCFLWLCTTVSQKQDLKRPRRVTGFVVRWALYAPVIYLNKSLQISALYTETLHLVPLLMLCFCLSNLALGMFYFLNVTKVSGFNYNYVCDSLFFFGGWVEFLWIILSRFNINRTFEINILCCLQ